MAMPMRRWDSTNRIGNSPVVCDAGRSSIPSLSSDSSLRSVNDLPQLFQSVFGFRYFNCLQSECFPVCFLSDVNMVISAPTGSGKTVLFELCILRILSRFIAADGRFYHSKGTLKTIYVAPSKALVQEKLRHWNEKFSSLGIICLELTSDNENYSIKNIQDADIILTTPEKFDAVSRFNMNGLSFFSDIALLLIDEVHLLNDPRGAALEAIVSKIKMVAKSPQMNMNPIAHVRFVAVSATIPNLEDLAEWLIVPPQGMKRFGEEMRPVKLTTKVFGYAAAKNDFLFEKRLENYIFDILMQFSRGKSAIVFCSTRKGAQEAAQKISQTAMKFGNSNPFIKSGEQQERLREASLSCNDRQMQAYILYGVGYHNGGLCMKDRNLIESLFLNGDIQVLCTTNTLAHGINLPAHTVVIKSTQHYNKEKNHYTEYYRSTVLQMCGRAGRPPFDDTGMVIIMTRKETVHLYENLLNGCETVESQLLSCMTEHLTAEIVQLTVPDITRAIEWMKCSFLYVRMKQKPENYGFEKGISKDRVERHMHEVCVQKVNELSKYQMIWTDEDGFVLNPLEPGKLMTKYYLKMGTMKHIMQTSPSCNLEDILQTVSRAEELSWIQLRRNEKKILNGINIDKDSRLRFHILGDRGRRKKRIQTREEKIFVLANDCLTGDPCAHDLSLSQDANSIGSNGSRVAKCMREYFIYKKNYKGALNSSLLAKSLHQKLWDDSPYLLKQLPGIGMVTAKGLHSMGVNSFQTLLEADPRRIEIITGRKYPFGNHIKDSLNVLPPKVEMNVETAESHGRHMPKLAMKLSRLSKSKSVKRHYADMFIGLQEDNLIVYHEKIRVEEFTSPYSTTITLPKLEHGKGTFKAHLIFEEYIGIDQYKLLKVSSELNSDITPRKVVTRQLTLTKPFKTNEVENGSKLPSPAQVEKTPPKESKEKLDFMPSFDLLDKELDEALLAMTEEEDDECRIIDDHTVFDHIRKKAKIFPTVAAPVDTPSLSPESLKLGRKRLREMHLGPHSLAEGSLDKDKSKEPDHETVSSVSETEKVDHSRTMAREISPYKPRFISRSLDIVNLMDDAGTSKSTGSLPPTVTISEEPKESKTAFDHVRKKFKRPLVTLNSKPSQPDSSTSSKPPDHFDQFDFSIIPEYTAKASHTSNNPQQNDTIVLLDSKPSQTHKGLSGYPGSSSSSKQPDDLDQFDFNIPEYTAKASRTSNNPQQNDTAVLLDFKPTQPQKGLSGHSGSSSSKQPDHFDQFDFSIIPEYTAKASRTSNNPQQNVTIVLLDSKPTHPQKVLSGHPGSSSSSKQPDHQASRMSNNAHIHMSNNAHIHRMFMKEYSSSSKQPGRNNNPPVPQDHQASRMSNNAQQNNTTVLLESKPTQPEQSISATPKGRNNNPPVPQDLPAKTKANECGDVNAPTVLPIIKKSPKSPGCWTAAAIVDAWKGDQFTGESYLGFRSYRRYIQLLILFYLVVRIWYLSYSLDRLYCQDRF